MTFTSLKWIKLRILLIAVGFVLYLGLVLIRSYELQISENSRVHNLVSKQYRATLPVNPKRGAIYDRNGKALALDIQVASVAVHPQKIEDIEGVVLALSKTTGLPVEKIRPKLTSEKKFEWIARRLSADRGEALQKQKWAGVVVMPEYRRYYPNKETAGNLLGAVGFDAKALGGIELSLDPFLKSASGKQFAEKDARGRLYTPVENLEIYHDIYLTIDLNIQFMAEKFLWENAKKYGVNSGFALVTNPQTGEILAMANAPSFNPNAYWQYPQESWKNHAVIDSFEPGSTFKPILAAAALDFGIVSPSDSFFCENGVYTIGKRIIHDHDPYGRLTFSEIIQVSSNIGITKVAQKVGKNNFYDFIVKAGFGQATGLNFPSEARGFVSSSRKWSDLELSNIAFGQGISVGGLQMAMVYGAFANKGIRMKPALISKIINSHGETVLENHSTTEGVLMSEAAARELTRMLEGAVGNGGTGHQASLAGYRIAGKTGTAQKVNPQTKQYDEEAYIGSFIGYVPAENPKYLIYVAYDSPREVHYGGVVAAPVFKNIAREALAYSGIPPEQEKLAIKSPLP